MAFDTPLTLVTYSASDEWVWCEDCDPPVPMNAMRLVPGEDRYEPSPNYRKALAEGRLKGHQRNVHQPPARLNRGGRQPSRMPTDAFRYVIFKTVDPRDRRRRIIGMHVARGDTDVEPPPLGAELVREGRAWSMDEADAVFSSIFWKRLKNRGYVKRHRARRRQPP